MTTTTTADLIAGLIDLADAQRPPHPAGPCSALCVASCAGVIDRTPDPDVDESLRG